MQGETSQNIAFVSEKSIQSCNGTFDHIVIGSSPLMLLQALALAEVGERVLLVDRDTQRGGAWQTTALQGNEGQPLHVENACHVIEVFPGVYECLEAASGTPFVVLKEQPIRIHPSGIIVPYFNRSIMLLSLLRLVSGYFSALVQTRVLRRDKEDVFLNFRNKLRSLLRYQLGEFWRGSPMKGPRQGFVDFIESLLRRCRENGVQFERFEVVELVHGQAGWEVVDARGSRHTATCIHVTTSANLQQIYKGHFKATRRDLVERIAVIVSISHVDLKTNQTYAAFWSDPLVSRISRLDTPNDSSDPFVRFLIEMKSKNILNMSGVADLLRTRLEAAQILQPGGSFDILGNVDCFFARNIDQLPEGEIDTNLFGYFSNGNLAAGVAAWLDQRCRISQSPRATKSLTA